MQNRLTPILPPSPDSSGDFLLFFVLKLYYNIIMKLGYRKETHKRIISFTLSEETIISLQSEANRSGKKVSKYLDDLLKETLKNG